MATLTRPAAATIESRVRRLRSLLTDFGSVCIGYSGGVDSVYLACVAVDVLGPDNVLAVTGRSAAYPQAQREVAVDCAHRFGIPHVEVDTDELADPNYAANPTNRCYYCKSELWPKLREVARERGLAVVLDGSNADDAGDYRPGFAAARENDVRSPLLEAGLTKEDVRVLSRERGLPTWDQPASPCLSSRLPYGIAVTPERLRQVETAEDALRALGYREFRVRHHDDCLRVEFAPAELDRAWTGMAAIHERLTRDSSTRVLVDVEGYRRGALNEVLVQLDGGARERATAGRTCATTVAASTNGASPVGTPAPEPDYADILLDDRAGYHEDIAVLEWAPLTTLGRAVAEARAAGCRYVTVDASRAPAAAAPDRH